jgi:hypothetical protein
MVVAEEINARFVTGTSSALDLFKNAEFTVRRVTGKDEVVISAQGSEISLIDDALVKAGINYRKSVADIDDVSQLCKAGATDQGINLQDLPHYRELQAIGLALSGDHKFFIQGRENLSKLFALEVGFSGSSPCPVLMTDMILCAANSSASSSTVTIFP